MPKIYYRCSNCLKITTTKYATYCPECGCARREYVCQHNYWWELLYLTVRDFIRKLK